MKPNSIKALVLAVLIGLTLGITGCARSPAKCASVPEGKLEQQCSESKEETSTGVMAPAPAHEPAREGGNDDMERLD